MTKSVHDFVKLTKTPEGGELDISNHVTQREAQSMEWGNRCAHAPGTEELSFEEKCAAIGVGEVENSMPILTQQPGRLQLVPRLWKYGKTIQIVGGHPSFVDHLRPEGVDEVWAINPRSIWPADKPPDLIVTRDITFLQGPTSADPFAPSMGVENLTRWPKVPVCVTADIGYWVAQRVLHGVEVLPHLLGDNREWYELALQNFFDGLCADIAGFSIGAAIALAKHAGAKIVLTGVVCEMTPAEKEKLKTRGTKSQETMDKENRHLVEVLSGILNKGGGRYIWTYGPTVSGSAAPVWNKTN